MKLNEMQLDEVTTLLLYGNSGTAKTWLAGTAGDNTVIIAPAQGISTLQSLLFKKLVGTNPTVEVVDELPMPDIAAGFDRIGDLVEKYLDEPSINTIVVDDTTNVRRMALNKGLELNQKLNRSQTHTKMKNMKSDAIVREMNDITMEMALMEAFVKKAVTYSKEAKKNFVLTAHERLRFIKPAKVGDPPTLDKIQPGFSGQTFPDDVTGLFDLIWHTEIRGGGDRIFYQVRTQGDSTTTAKTRWGGLFPVLFEKSPNLAQVFECIKTQTPYPVGK
jgi:hypothetical protein